MSAYAAAFLNDSYVLPSPHLFCGFYVKFYIILNMLPKMMGLYIYNIIHSYYILILEFVDLYPVIHRGNALFGIFRRLVRSHPDFENIVIHYYVLFI